MTKKNNQNLKFFQSICLNSHLLLIFQWKKLIVRWWRPNIVGNNFGITSRRSIQTIRMQSKDQNQLYVKETMHTLLMILLSSEIIGNDWKTKVLLISAKGFRLCLIIKLKWWKSERKPREVNISGIIRSNTLRIFKDNTSLSHLIKLRWLSINKGQKKAETPKYKD